LPRGAVDKRGWWADTEDFKIGSRLWLLERSAFLPSIPAQVEQFISEALQWLVDDGAAAAVNVTATRLDIQTLEITIEIVQPEKQANQVFRYRLNWEAQILKRG